MNSPDKRDPGETTPGKKATYGEAPINNLLKQTPVVVNVGLEGFANELSARQVDVCHLDWRPPAGGDAELADLLAKLGS